MTVIQPPKAGWQLRIFPVFSVLGWVFILVPLLIGVFVLAPTASGYWGGKGQGGTGCS
jgi:hypothetical protein